MQTIARSHAGRQLRWYLRRLAAAGEGASAADRAHFAPALRTGRWAPGPGDPKETWRRLSAQIGAFELASVDEASDFAISVTLSTARDKRWRVSCQVEKQEPHRICGLDWQRLFDFDVTVREATEDDAAVLAEIERHCPIVLDDATITFDRGDDYFAFARLMEEVTVSLGFVDGIPAAINCGAVHGVRVGGVERRVMTAIHTRIVPEHQRKGLWGAVSRVLGTKYPPGTIDGSRGYVSVDNAAMQKGFKNMPDRWEVRALRVLLPCSSLAGPTAGRPATPRDSARVAQILNACHSDEEMYLPYNAESLAARLQRAPKRYSWDRVWITGCAVVGVWPAGESIRLVVESGERHSESGRGLVLDYGYLPGAEDEFEGLLRLVHLAGRPWPRHAVDLHFRAFARLRSAAGACQRD